MPPRKRKEVSPAPSDNNPQSTLILTAQKLSLPQFDIGPSPKPNPSLSLTPLPRDPLLRLPPELLHSIVSHFSCPYPWSHDRELPILSLDGSRQAAIRHAQSPISAELIALAALDADIRFPDDNPSPRDQSSLFSPLQRNNTLHLLSPSDMTTLKCQLYQDYTLWRKDILALSETCHLLREFTLPVLWERIVIDTGNHGGAWYMDVAKLTEARCRTLLAREGLRQYVRSAVLSITRCRAKDILPLVANTLSKLPNLHTLTISHFHPRALTPFRTAIQNTQLLSVRRLFISPSAHHLISACPNVHELHCMASETSSADGKVILGHLGASTVRILRGDGTVWDEKALKRLVKAVPNLTEFDYHGFEITKCVADILTGLTELRIVRVLRLACSPNTRSSVPALKAADFRCLEDIVIVTASGMEERIPYRST